jgi:hypothetical protein
MVRCNPSYAVPDYQTTSTEVFKPAGNQFKRKRKRKSLKHFLVTHPTVEIQSGATKMKSMLMEVVISFPTYVTSIA